MSTYRTDKDIVYIQTEYRQSTDTSAPTEPWWEIDEDRSILYDSRHIRMKKENRGYEDGQESNFDRTTPRSRMLARMKRDILMKLEIEIELLERESEGRQGETGEFENPMSSELILQEIGDRKSVV